MEGPIHHVSWREAGAARPSPIRLPAPRLTGPMTLESALVARRTVAELSPAPITLAEVGQILWAAQGVLPPGRRTAPSAGALYPLEIYLVAGAVQGLVPGVYGFRPNTHDLAVVAGDDRRVALVPAIPEGDWAATVPAVLTLGAVPGRTTWKYGFRGIRYVYFEVGHAAENVYLQVAALGLATAFVGDFSEEGLRVALHLPAQVQPLALMPIGHR